MRFCSISGSSERLLGRFWTFHWHAPDVRAAPANWLSGSQSPLVRAAESTSMRRCSATGHTHRLPERFGPITVNSRSEVRYLISDWAAMRKGPVAADGEVALQSSTINFEVAPDPVVAGSYGSGDPRPVPCSFPPPNTSGREQAPLPSLVLYRAVQLETMAQEASGWSDHNQLKRPIGPIGVRLAPKHGRLVETYQPPDI